MFFFPKEIMSHIYEFDPTYHIEYKKVISKLKKLPVFIQVSNEYDIQPFMTEQKYIYMFITTVNTKYYFESIYPPKLLYTMFDKLV
jgi:hypothetical protein